jgi:hypothetical protein
VPFPIWRKFLKDHISKTNFFTQVGKNTFAQIFSNNLNVISGQKFDFLGDDLMRFNPAWWNFADAARKILSAKACLAEYSCGALNRNMWE